jgi:hypothetical protein
VAVNFLLPLSSWSHAASVAAVAMASLGAVATLATLADNHPHLLTEYVGQHPDVVVRPYFTQHRFLTSRNGN